MALSKSRRLGLLGTISALALPFALPATQAMAQETAAASDEIIVTATRRAVSVQEVPINVTALGGEQLEAQGISELSELSTQTPGLFIADQSSREGNPIIARGLNATNTSGIGTAGNDGGGTVATYLGEVPFYIDLNMTDMERVEVLLGPQGTLYGAGTLGGAIRYLPNRPEFGSSSITYRGDVYGYSEGDRLSTSGGMTFNIPLLENLALRGSIDKLDDNGFIDYTHLVNEIGVSDSENPADLHTQEDANTEDTLSTRFSLRWQPIPDLDINLSYYSKAGHIDGRQVSHYRSVPATGHYEAAFRVPETIERNTELLALEATYDLDWGTLTSATGYSQYSERQQRDQTPLLTTLQLSYETFPYFTAYTYDTAEEENFSQEVRFVSAFDGPANFILGAFFNRQESGGDSLEFTPNLGEFLSPGSHNPDDIEYYEVGSDSTEQKAIYGEFAYDVTERWNVTFGSRYYWYRLKVHPGGAGFPLFDPSGDLGVSLESETSAIAEGALFKVNTSYDFTDDIMGYFTFSEGFRTGGSNGIHLCSQAELDDFDLTGDQQNCALTSEYTYEPDTTQNYELGLRTEWFGGDLVINGDIYYILWDSIQLDSATQLGGLSITKNAGEAQSYGLELQSSWNVTDRWTLNATYAFNHAELTRDLPGFLVATADPATSPSAPFDLVTEDVYAGDRLPGFPSHQASLSTTYEQPMTNGWELNWSYGIHGISDVTTRPGTRGGGELIDGYILHDASVALDAGDWTATFYVNNIFDEFYETGVNGTTRYNQPSAANPGFTNRRYFSTVGTPRVIGIRFTKTFGE